MDQRADKSTTTALRKKLRAAGYDPIPVNGKKPHLDAWQTKLAAPDAEIDRWGKAHRHAKTVASASVFAKDYNLWQK
ncbi:hypothetical protein [Bradyrhizobium sp. URHC0002]